MSKYSKEIIEKHIKTHTERSSDDYSAVSTLQAFLKSDGKINVNFAYNDKWPNIDGTFEYVSEPILSRRPKQNFVVQIKGTHLYTESDGVVKYTLKSLAFPAYIMSNVTLDPGILFVVLNADCRGAERVFWKYMSVEFLESINFENGSMTVSFSKEEEILNTDESIKQFCAKLEDIVEQHSFVRKLDNWNYSKNDVIKIIEACNTDITESLDRMDILNETRDNVSRRMLTRLYDLCSATLLLNVIEGGVEKASLQLAWERAILNIETKYLGTFLKGLQYLGRRIPDSGQSERLMLKYYNFLWQIRKFLKEKKGMYILHNLEKFPLRVDELDHHFYELVSKAVEGIDCSKNTWGITRFYIQKKTPFFVEGERYYEVTLQMTSVYATKYNRITIYTKENISTNYPIQICSVDTKIELWGIETKVKVITGWRVSISSPCLNKLAKVLNMRTNLSMKYGEYNALMIFLTKTGINLLDLIDLQEDVFHKVINSIYKDTNTSTYKYVLLKLRETCSKFSKVRGSNVIRYLLLALREEYLEGVMPTKYDKLLCDEFYIARRCFPFDKNPLLSDLSGHKTSGTSQTKQ
ncbi:MAG: hypothetical protein IKB01_09055, partial [Lachnospiraceae bacterium]|nr:hypothetical protein [Lachnospiraceae bacterium]